MLKKKIVKITVVGDAVVEKTSFLTYYTTKQNLEDYAPIVFDNYSTTIKVDGAEYDVKLWDTSGQEDYELIRPLSYPHTTCFLIFFAIDNRNSLENVKDKWIPEVRRHMPKTPYILVGTTGVNRNQLTISPDEINKTTRQIKASRYFECSPKTGTGVDEIIDSAIRCSHEVSTSFKTRLSNNLSQIRPNVSRKKISQMSQEMTKMISKVKHWIVQTVRERTAQISIPEEKKQKKLNEIHELV